MAAWRPANSISHVPLYRRPPRRPRKLRARIRRRGFPTGRWSPLHGMSRCNIGCRRTRCIGRQRAHSGYRYRTWGFSMRRHGLPRKGRGARIDAALMPGGGPRRQRLDQARRCQRPKLAVSGVKATTRKGAADITTALPPGERAGGYRRRRSVELVRILGAGFRWLTVLERRPPAVAVEGDASPRSSRNPRNSGSSSGIGVDFESELRPRFCRLESAP